MLSVLDEKTTNRKKGLYRLASGITSELLPLCYYYRRNKTGCHDECIFQGDQGQSIIFMNVETTPSTPPPDLREFSPRQPEMWLGGRFYSFLCV